MLISCSIFLFLDSTKAHLCGSKFKLILSYLILSYSYPSQTEGFNSRWMGPLCSKLKLCAWDDNINNICTLWHHKDLKLLICQPFLNICWPWFETMAIVAAGKTEKQKRSTLKCHWWNENSFKKKKKSLSLQAKWPKTAIWWFSFGFFFFVLSFYQM